MSTPRPPNDEIADLLDRAGELLDLLDANPFRVRSYRRAAAAVRRAATPIAERLQEGGAESLTEIPNIGRKLAGSIEEIVDTGRFGLVERLEAEVTPEAVLARVPGIGDTLAERIHDRLGIDSLEELEMAAHDGRLAEVDGMGDERVRGVRDALAGMLGRSARRRARHRRESDGGAGTEPPVQLLLEVDEDYRRRAEAGKLRTIAPRRFNPEGEAWLPIMETEREGWELTALYSNTARAHRLGMTRDWVVIYWEDGNGAEGQSTVITARSGPLDGRRIAVGRERECLEHFQ
jgi:hypothetical protein